MKKKPAIIAVAAVAFFAIVAFDIQSDNGKAGYTGSPSENKCNSCHSGSTLNDGTGSITITSPNMTNWEYVAGQTYQIDVTVTRSGNSLFGFGCEALDGVNHNGGTLVVSNSAQTHILNATISSYVRKNMTHQLNAGASAGSHTFSFNWTAPASGSGQVKFYATGVAANANGSDTGDHVYSTSQAVTELNAGVNDAAATTSLLAVFPSPASENVNLRYTGKAGERVQISMYSIDGKMVSTLLDETADGLQHTVPVALPGDVTPGVYLLRMVSGTTVSTTRLIVK